MPITIACPHCRQTYRVNESTAGKTVKCKGCGKAFTAAAAGSAPTQARPTAGRSPSAAPVARQSNDPAYDDAPGDDMFSALSSAAEAEHASPSHAAPQAYAVPSSGQAPYPAQPYAPQAAYDPPCPGCGAPLSAAQVVCTRCGFNRRTGQRMQTAAAPASRYLNHGDDRDAKGFRPNHEYDNPGLQMLESAASKAAVWFVVAVIAFFVIVMPIYSIYQYYQIPEQFRSGVNAPGVGKIIGGFFFIGLAVGVASSLVALGMGFGARIGAAIMRHHLPEGMASRLAAMVTVGWLPFLIYLMVNIGDTRGAPAMGVLTGIFGSFALWFLWLATYVAASISTSIKLMLRVVDGMPLGLMLVLIFGTLLMFPVYLFMTRTKLKEALVGFAFTIMGFAFGSLVGGPAMWLILKIAEGVLVGDKGGRF